MSARSITILVSALSVTLPSAPAGAVQNQALREDRIPVGNASLYLRDIGRGQPIIVLHGGKVILGPWRHGIGFTSSLR